MALAREFGVMATPSLAVVENGTLAQLIVGAQSEARIRKLLATT
jgi:thioredoxin 1